MKVRKIPDKKKIMFFFFNEFTSSVLKTRLVAPAAAHWQKSVHAGCHLVAQTSGWNIRVSSAHAGTSVVAEKTLHCSLSQSVGSIRWSEWVVQLQGLTLLLRCHPNNWKVSICMSFGVFNWSEHHEGFSDCKREVLMTVSTWVWHHLKLCQ